MNPLNSWLLYCEIFCFFSVQPENSHFFTFELAGFHIDAHHFDWMKGDRHRLATASLNPSASLNFDNNLFVAHLIKLR